MGINAAIRLIVGGGGLDEMETGPEDIDHKIRTLGSVFTGASRSSSAFAGALLHANRRKCQLAPALFGSTGWATGASELSGTSPEGTFPEGTCPDGTGEASADDDPPPAAFSASTS